MVDRFAPEGEYVAYDPTLHEQALTDLARRLGAEEFGTNWEGGRRTMDWEQVYRSIETETGLDLSDYQSTEMRLIRREYRKTQPPEEMP